MTAIRPRTDTRATAALAALLEALAARGYRWTTPTPETQRRVLERPQRERARNLTDIFGWSLPFPSSIVEPALLSLMHEAAIIVPRGELLASTVRVSSLDGLLFLHAAYPTTAEDSVFFGPDTYRFARFLKAGLAGPQPPIRRLIDIGCGSGAGAIVAARASGAREIVMADINPAALRLARINARAAGLTATAIDSDVLAGVAGNFDLIVANPPYMMDERKRAYRHGGPSLGADLSLRIGRETADRLDPGGTLMLYTASAIVDGVDRLEAAIVPMLERRGCTVTYEEIDPDVFGEELERPAYHAVDRIAAVGIVAIKGGPQ